jgi:serpin B
VLPPPWSACDLTGINLVEPLWVGGSFHKTFVVVDEKGVEAAAATAVVGDTDGGFDVPVTPPVEIFIDEPFYFLVRDRLTGAPLFAGFIADPSLSP